MNLSDAEILWYTTNTWQVSDAPKLARKHGIENLWLTLLNLALTKCDPTQSGSGLFVTRLHKIVFPDSTPQLTPPAPEVPQSTPVPQVGTPVPQVLPLAPNWVEPWQATLLRLSRKFSQIAMDHFELTRLLAFDGLTAVVGVPTEFLKMWLERRCYQSICQELGAVMGVDRVDVNFVIGGLGG